MSVQDYLKLICILNIPTVYLWFRDSDGHYPRRGDWTLGGWLFILFVLHAVGCIVWWFNTYDARKTKWKARLLQARLKEASGENAERFSHLDVKFLADDRGILIFESTQDANLHMLSIHNNRFLISFSEPNRHVIAVGDVTDANKPIVSRYTLDYLLPKDGNLKQGTTFVSESSRAKLLREAQEREERRQRELEISNKVASIQTRSKTDIGSSAVALYVMGHDATSGPIKIGISASPYLRAKNLQTGNHTKIVVFQIFWLLCRADAEASEEKIHAVFAGEYLGIKGEWFNLAPQTAMDRIEKMLADMIREGMIDLKLSNTQQRAIRRDIARRRHPEFIGYRYRHKRSGRYNSWA